MTASNQRGRTKRTWALRSLFRVLAVAGALVVPALVLAQVGTEFGSAESFASNETLTADKLNRLVTSLRNAGPGLGSVIAHMPNVSGAQSVAQMNQRGWAECDGTATTEVTGAIIAATPDLRGQFLRGIGGKGPATAGTSQKQATGVNGLAHDHKHMSRVSDSPTYCNEITGQSHNRLSGAHADWTYNSSAADQGCAYLTGVPTATGADAAPITSTDTETRPDNIGVVWMMRVR
jgi:hypothetical protein